MTIDHNTPQKSVALSVVLNLIWPGAGCLYAGASTGLAVFLIIFGWVLWILFAPIAIVASNAAVRAHNAKVKEAVDAREKAVRDEQRADNDRRDALMLAMINAVKKD